MTFNSKRNRFVPDRSIHRLILIIGLIGLCTHANAGKAYLLIDKAEGAVESGEVDSEVHLKPLIDLLLVTRSDDIADELIRAISHLGEARGSSPVRVKKYLRDNAPDALLSAAKKNFDLSTRGAALLALRDLDASDDAFDEAIAMARNDTSEQSNYLKSYAKLLENWKNWRRPSSMPDQTLMQVDPAQEHKALEYLRKRRINVSIDSAVRSAYDGQTEDLAALLDAGVIVNAKDTVGKTVADGALMGCASGRVPEATVLETIELLHQRGADFSVRDSNNNTLLMRAAQQCSASVVDKLLDYGVGVDPVNTQNFTPLSMALVSGKLEVARLLVDRGAALTQEGIDKLFIEVPSDPDLQQLLDQALGNSNK